MDDSKTVFCGNLSDKVTEEILFELFLQAAPLERVRIPTDKGGRRSNFAFITFKHQESVDYVLQLLNGIRLYDKCINIKPRNANSANRPPDKYNDFSIHSRLGFAPQQNQFQGRPQENMEAHGSRRDYNYRDETPRNFRDSYRDDSHRDNSYSRHDDRERHERYDSNKRRPNYDRRGSFNDRNPRNRKRYY